MHMKMRDFAMASPGTSAGPALPVAPVAPVARVARVAPVVLAALVTLAALTTLLPAGLAMAAFELKPWTGGATPPLSLTDHSGRKVDLAQYKGKVVLVNFWATWCAPCIAELPAMQALRDKLAPSGFEVLAVNYREAPKKIDDFLAKRPLALPIPRDADGAAAKAWGVRTFPTSFLIDADGQVRYWVIGDADWLGANVDARIRELLPKR